MAKTIEEQVKFWKAHYMRSKSIVTGIDKGEKITPSSIGGITVGQRAHSVNEANIAVDRLNALGNFDLHKIQ